MSLPFSTADHQLLGSFTFLDFLAVRITGKSLLDYPEPNDEAVAEKCFEIYKTAIIDYFKDNFPPIEATIIQKGFQDGINVIKTEEMQEHFNEANQHFFENVKIKEFSNV
jgi:hypothetical protein